MTQAARKLTFEEYLALNAEDWVRLGLPEGRCELEVVSPGSINENRDYTLKRSEYAARRVPEYWAIDPEESKITVFTLVNGSIYEEAVYTGEMVIRSRFEALRLTAEHVLKRKR